MKRIDPVSRQWQILLPLILMLSGISGCASLQDTEILKQTFTMDQGDPLQYHLLKIHPTASYERFPLVVIFHGTGDTDAAFLSLWQREAESRRYMVLAPFLDHAYENQPADIDPVNALVNHIAKNYPIDKNRVYLAGASSGAIVARWMMLRNPGFWRATAFAAGPGKNAWEASVDMKRLPPMLFVNGVNDPHFRIQDIRSRVAAIDSKGGKVQLLEDPAADHGFREEWVTAILDWFGNYS